MKPRTYIDTASIRMWRWSTSPVCWGPETFLKMRKVWAFTLPQMDCEIFRWVKTWLSRDGRDRLLERLRLGASGGRKLIRDGVGYSGVERKGWDREMEIIRRNAGEELKRDGPRVISAEWVESFWRAQIRPRNNDERVIKPHLGLFARSPTSLRPAAVRVLLGDTVI